MTAHLCSTFDPGCYRCELGRDEVERYRPGFRVVCPICSAPPGAACRDDENATVTLHPERRRVPASRSVVSQKGDS